ncbi:MAG: thioredoxin fold domain-containing protein [Pirellulaceae bacterium]
MKKSIVAVWMVILALALSLGNTLQGAEGPINWGTNIVTAYQKALQEGKPLVVHLDQYLSGERTPFCKKMAEETLNGEVLGCYAPHAIFVRVDRNSVDPEVKKVVDSLQIKDVPVVVLMDAQKEQLKEVVRYTGYYTQDEFLTEFPEGLIKAVQGIAARNPMPQDAGKAKVAAATTALLACTEEVSKAAGEWRQVLNNVADGNVKDPATLERAYHKWLLTEEKLAAGYVPFCTLGSKEADELSVSILKMFRFEVPLCSKLNVKVQNLMKTSDLGHASAREEIRKLIMDADAETAKQLESLKAELSPVAQRFAARYR